MSNQKVELATTVNLTTSMQERGQISMFAPVY